jgi:hypothetical protein
MKPRSGTDILVRRMFPAPTEIEPGFFGNQARSLVSTLSHAGLFSAGGIEGNHENLVMAVGVTYWIRTENFKS